jgi:uncharacterized protein
MLLKMKRSNPEFQNMKTGKPICFFLVTFLWTWFFWAPFVLEGLGIYTLDEDLRTTVSLPVLILGAFGPAVGALFCVFRESGRKGLKKYVSTFLSLRFGWKVWAAIFTVIPLANLIAWYLPELFGQERLTMLLPGIYIFPVYWLIMVFLGGGQEEIGWRGYALPILEARYGAWQGNLMLGSIWAFWHVPLYLVPGHMQQYLPFVPFLIGCIGMSFFYSWIMKASGGRPLSAMIAHGTINAFIPVFPTIIMVSGVFQARFWLHEVIFLVAGVIFLVSLSGKNSKQYK